MNWINEHIVSLTVFFPLLGSLLLLLTPNNKVSRLVALVWSCVTFLFGLHIWYYFDGTSAKVQMSEYYKWLPHLGMNYIVGVDGLSLLLILLTTFIVPLVILSLWNAEKNLRALLSLILLLETGMLGALVCFDLILFYIFWEAMLIPMYFIIGYWGGKNRIYATTKFVLYTVFGSLLMLLAIIVLMLNHYEQVGNFSTSLMELYKLNLDDYQQKILFFCFALAFAIKVPVWPFHTWLPHAHTEAPTAGSVILAAVLLKMGTYGLLRFAIPLFPQGVIAFAPLLLCLGVIGIIYGALTAWTQQDAKKLVAYSSVSHLGYVVIGSLILAGNSLSKEALAGASYQMINHGISTGMLFFLVGMLYERRHTRMLSDYGGVAKQAPWFAVMLIIATLGSVGLPSTGGFIGEFLVLLGVFSINPLCGAFATLGVLLGAIYMLSFCKQILFGKPHPTHKPLTDLTFLETLYITPLALLIFVMGIFPNIFLDKVKPSLDYLAQNFTEYRLTVDNGKIEAIDHLAEHDTDSVDKN